jgi:hypothetical protein
VDEEPDEKPEEESEEDPGVPRQSAWDEAVRVGPFRHGANEL